MRLTGVILGAAFLCLVAAPKAFCANVVGTVSDAHSNAISGVVITVETTAGRVFGQATTDAQGHYQISGLAPGTYQFFLNPLGTGFKAGSGVSAIDASGLTINWRLSTGAPALALADPSAGTQIAGDPFGYSLGEFASIVTLGAAGVAAGVVGGYGAAGGFSGGPSGRPTSSSM